MKKKGIALLVLAIIVAGAAGFYVYSGQEAQAEEVEIAEVVVQTDDIMIDFVGDGNAEREMETYGFEISGQVDHVHVAVGDVVEPGTAMVTLVAEDVEEALEQARLDLESAQLSLQVQQKSSGNAAVDYRYQKDSKYTAYMDAKETYEKMASIPQAYAQTEIDKAKGDMETALEAYENFLATGYSDGAQEVRQKEIAVERAQMEVKNLEAQLMDTTLFATQTIRVVSIGADAGDDVGAGVSVLQGEVVKAPAVIVNIGEDEIGDAHVGQKVYVEFEALPGSVFEGAVEEITRAPVTDNNGIVSYPVTVRLGEEDEAVMDGMTAVLNFVITEAKDVLVLDNDAVQKVDGMQVVQVKRDDGSIETVEIRTGLTDGKQVQVLAGLEAGDRVVYEKR